MNEITFLELEGESTELLPERETLLWNTNIFRTNYASVVASNSSLALNAASLFSAASSNALQSITVAQG
ncbi:hypothetical protein ET495_17010 [Xylanimonas allomyrinae]|uniref:Uncharacterized protein n=1 Tax=Xylanimonas allomyrinae TaxID=2509459 RepID=A0A4P6EVS6_9MICO|nr:hypothetical protein [Xylanimonas allomyrinae]QAY64617.1 hypothetical protein ET495_17010 [Xylanimonas allomyrinae]